MCCTDADEYAVPDVVRTFAIKLRRCAAAWRARAGGRLGQQRGRANGARARSFLSGSSEIRTLYDIEYNEITEQ
jgi:hypothetical protein